MVIPGGPCTIHGCRRSAMFNSSVCYKHRHDLATASPSSNLNDPITFERKYSFISFEIDGRKKSIDSKKIDELTDKLVKAKRFWIVDLSDDESEFVQYAIEKGELEHWDNKEMFERKVMSMAEAIVLLSSKITGNFPTHSQWWASNDVPSMENATSSNQAATNKSSIPDLMQNQNTVFAVGIVLVFTILLIIDADTLLMVPGDICCGLIFAGGAGAASIGRKDSGKFSNK